MILGYTIQPLAHVRVDNSHYNVYVSVCRETLQLHVFRYNEQGCDYDVCTDQEQAQVSIARPFSY